LNFASIMTAPSDKQPMKERILATADRLFYQHGIQAVGVDTIAAEVGISKRTLYNHFPCKNDLVAAYLIGRSDQAPPSDKPPAEQILRTFDRLDRAFATAEFRGCPFVNAIGELGDSADRDIKRIARDFKEARRTWFRERLRELDVANADELATQFAILVDGAIAAKVVRGDKSAARAARQMARVLLENAGVELDDDTKAQTNTGRHTRA
jgi:AcrR family transcriptional regulator